MFKTIKSLVFRLPMSVVSEIQPFEISPVSPAGDFGHISSILSQRLLSNHTTADFWGDKKVSDMQNKRN